MFNGDYSGRKYCTKLCYTQSQKGKQPPPNVMNKRGNKPNTQVLKKCKHCSKEYKVTQGRQKQSSYCSQTCYLNDRFDYKGHCLVCKKNISIGKYCKDCITNKDVSKMYDRSRWMERKKQLWDTKNDIIKELGGKCVKCGISDIRVLDINHIDRSKKLTFAKRQYSWERRLKDWKHNSNNLEILCANCHRIHTWNQMNYGVNPEYVQMANKRLGAILP